MHKNYYNNDVNELGYNDDPSDTPSILRNLKLKNINRLVLGHLNINSLAGKFDQLKNHPSIIMINQNVSFESRFSFQVVNENDIKQEVSNLN